MERGKPTSANVAQISSHDRTQVAFLRIEPNLSTNFTTKTNVGDKVIKLKSPPFDSAKATRGPITMCFPMHRKTRLLCAHIIADTCLKENLLHFVDK